MAALNGGIVVAINGAVRRALVWQSHVSVKLCFAAQNFKNCTMACTGLPLLHLVMVAVQSPLEKSVNKVKSDLP